MASNPPAECCTKSIKHDGTPIGTITAIQDIEVYFAKPTKPTTKAIIIFSDVFGLSQNIKLVADDFASQGYLTLVPDILHGDVLKPEDFGSGKVDLGKWFASHGPNTIDPIADIVIKDITKNHGIEKLGAIGYCLGAKYVVRNLKEGILGAGFVAHPSDVSDEELSAINKPLSIAAAELDDIFTAELRHKSEKILAEIKVPYQINYFGSVDHGFALRGNLNDPKVLFAKESSFKQAVDWFNFWL